jgi:hypothetical protein
MTFFSSIGSFFKGAANKVNSAILKPIGNFVTHTIPDTAGKILGGIKDGGKAVLDKLPDIIDSGGKAIGSIIDKGSSLVTGVVDKVNPLNNLGTYLILGIGAFVLIEFMKSPASQTLAQRVPLAIP